MKTRLALIIALVIGLTGIGHTLFAADHAPAVQNDEAQLVSAIQIQGIMQESTDGLSLEYPNSTYQLKGCEKIDGMAEETLKSMIGRFVKVRGGLERRGADLLIHVTDVETVN